MKRMLLLLIVFMAIGIANADIDTLTFSSDWTTASASSGWCGGNEAQMFAGSECYDLTLSSGTRLATSYNISIATSQQWNPTSHLIIGEISSGDVGNCSATMINTIDVGTPTQQTISNYTLNSSLDSNIASGSSVYVRVKTTAGGIAVCMLGTTYPSELYGEYTPAPPDPYLEAVEGSTAVIIVGIIIFALLGMIGSFIVLDSTLIQAIMVVIVSAIILILTGVILGLI